MEREYEDNRWKALFDAMQANERAAYLRAGTIAAMVINVNLGKDADPLTAADIFPFLKGEDASSPPKEMTTAETVQHLRRGFNLYIPERYR